MFWAKQLSVSPLSTVYVLLKRPLSSVFLWPTESSPGLGRHFHFSILIPHHQTLGSTFHQLDPSPVLLTSQSWEVSFPVCSIHSFHQMLLHHPYARARDKRPPHISQARIPTATEPGSHPPCEMLPGAFSGHSVPTG